MTNCVPWVSEWRITDSSKLDKDHGWHYKITNGGVYSTRRTYEEAKEALIENIDFEIHRYRIGLMTCPYCGRQFSRHSGSRSYEHCLCNLAIQKHNREVRT